MIRKNTKLNTLIALSFCSIFVINQSFNVQAYSEEEAGIKATSTYQEESETPVFGSMSEPTVGNYASTSMPFIIHFPENKEEAINTDEKKEENPVLVRANANLGKAYGWACTGPDAFDCSGFVGYCLTGAYERLGTTYTFLEWPQTNDPKPGDVCVNSYHCGIYIGNGQMIHAADEGSGVIIGPVTGDMIYVKAAI